MFFQVSNQEVGPISPHIESSNYLLTLNRVMLFQWRSLPTKTLQTQPLPSGNTPLPCEDAWTRLPSGRDHVRRPASIGPQARERGHWGSARPDWRGLQVTAATGASPGWTNGSTTRLSPAARLYFRSLSWGVVCISALNCWASYYLLLLPMFQVGKWWSRTIPKYPEFHSQSVLAAHQCHLGINWQLWYFWGFLS